MNKGVKFALIGGAIALGFYYFKKLRATSKLLFYPKNVRIVGNKIKDFRIVLDIDVNNPTNSNINIDSVNLLIKSDSTELGRIFVNTPKIINSNSTTLLSLPLTLSKINAYFFLYEVIAKGKNKVTIDGTINSEGLPIPIKEDISFL